LEKNTGNYVKIGSAIFQGDKRIFTSRMKTFCPGTVRVRVLNKIYCLKKDIFVKKIK
jgi:hypothetical protein